MSSVLLDTSFLIRLVTDSDKLHCNALDYFRYFLNNKIIMRVSTIAIAEFCVKGSIAEIPLTNILPLPFNVNHATTAGELHKDCNIGAIRENTGTKRNIIFNDIKMFAQAHQEVGISSFVTSDSKAVNYFNKIKEETPLAFDFIDINIPLNQYIGMLF